MTRRRTSVRDRTQVTPHDGPPDHPGWWVIEIPTREPFIIRVEMGSDFAFIRAWMDGYKCWRMTDLLEEPRLEAVLSSLLDRPRLIWDLVPAMGMLMFAGKWEPFEEKVGFVRKSTHSSGEKVAVATVYPHGDKWSILVEDTVRTADSEAQGKETADRLLRGRGYFLIDG
jgi:hypothetical protein